MQFCRYCGGGAPDDALFCARCGRSLLSTGQEVTGQSNSQATHPGRPQQYRKEDNERREFAPLPPLSEQSAPPSGNVPFVQGTPQAGSVPSVASQGISTAAKVSAITAGTLAKFAMVAVMCAAIVVASVKVIPPLLTHSGTGTSTPHAGPTHKLPTVVTVKMPPTETSCPAGGQGRAAVTRPLALGKDQNIVYTKNIKSSNSTPISGTLYRYDVTTSKTTQILNVENVDIADAQVSADGQWVVFISEVGGLPAIQMVRLDGQGLQTLYCNPPTQYSYQQVILGILLSPDQKLLAFYTGLSQDQETFELLNMTNGMVQRALQPERNSMLYEPAMWLNGTQLYVRRYPLFKSALLLLDTSKGADQPISALTDLVDSPDLTDYALSPDHTQLFTSYCQVCGQGIFIGPSSISVQPATGTTQHTIYTVAKGAILSLVATSNTRLLFYISSYSEDPTRPADTSQVGAWEINTDGSDLIRLTNGNADVARYDPFDISKDGKWYISLSNSGLFFGSVNGGPLTQFASVTDTSSTSLAVVGWTTM